MEKPDSLPTQTYAADLPTGDRNTVDSDQTADYSPATTRLPHSEISLPGYTILGELGRGGMGVVYKARDQKLNRDVALKMVLGGVVAGSAAFQRFLTEAEALAALHHPSVVQVYERGDYQGLPYFAMEFCPGGSLAAKVKDQPLEAREAALLVEQLARGMAAAHERGILHRDLKPDNVLFASDGTPKITDFGLAKLVSGGVVSGESSQAHGSTPLTTNDSPLTMSGAVMGTPSYMSPEQARGDTKNVGPSADVWALGAILYRLVTGRPPFLGANAVETLRQVVEAEPISPSELTPGLPRDIATIALKCLAKEPAKRYVSASELTADLRRFLDDKPIVARAVGRGERAVKWVKRNKVVSGAMAVVFLALAAGAGVSLAFGLEASRRAEEAKDAAEREKGETARANRETQDAINARDAEGRAKRLAQAQTARAEGLLMGTRLQQASDAVTSGNARLAKDVLNDCQWNLRGWEYGHLWTRITPPWSFELKGSIGFSPDGSTLVVSSFRDTKDGRKHFFRACNLDSGTETLLPAAPGDVPTSVFPGIEKHELLGVRRDLCVQRWDLRTGQLTSTSVGNPSEYKRNLISLISLSPDRKFIAYAPSVTAPPPSEYVQHVKLWDVEKDKFVKTLTRHTNAIDKLKYSPKGTHIASSSNTSVKIWDLTADSEMIVDLGDEFCRDICFTPDGSGLLAVTHPDGKTATLKFWDIADKKVTRTIGVGETSVNELDVTADGKFLATGEQDSRVRVWDYATGKLLRTYLGHTWPVFSVRFSPDGKRLVSVDNGAVMNLWDSDRDSAVPTLTTPAVGGRQSPVRSAAFSPDGKTFITGDQDGRFHQWDAEARTRIKSLSAQIPGDQFRGEVWDIAYSPDGTQFATCGQELKLWDAKTGELVRAFRGHVAVVFNFAFSPDGKRLYASPIGHHPRTGATTPADVWVWEVDTGKKLAQFTAAEKRLESEGGKVDAITFSPDGQLVTSSIPPNGGGVIKFWDTTDHAVVRTLTGHAGRVQAIAFNRDGTRMASSCSGGELIIWDLKTGNPLHETRVRGGQLDSLRFSPDGNRLFAGCSDGSVRVWDPELFQEMLALPGHAKGDVIALALSPDGKRLVSGGADGSIRIWESLRTPDYADLKGHRTPVTAIAFALVVLFAINCRVAEFCDSAL